MRCSWDWTERRSEEPSRARRRQFDVGAADMTQVHDSWRPADLTVTLASEANPPSPTVGHRSDDRPLLYPGKTHSISSEPEAGKTWFALMLCAQEMADNHAVMYLDYED